MCVFMLDECGWMCVCVIEVILLRVDLGWMSRFGAVRGRAFELAVRVMFIVLLCVILS